MNAISFDCSNPIQCTVLYMIICILVSFFLIFQPYSIYCSVHDNKHYREHLLTFFDQKNGYIILGGGGAVSRHHFGGGGGAVSRHHWGGCSLLTSFWGAVQSRDIILGVCSLATSFWGGGGCSLTTSFWGGGVQSHDIILGEESAVLQYRFEGVAVLRHHFGGSSLATSFWGVFSLATIF